MAQIHISKDPPGQISVAFALFHLSRYNAYQFLPMLYRGIGSFFENGVKSRQNAIRTDSISLEKKPHNKIIRILNNLNRGSERIRAGQRPDLKISERTTKIKFYLTWKIPAPRCGELQ